MENKATKTPDFSTFTEAEIWNAMELGGEAEGLTLTVPQAGRMVGLGHNASYNAAKKGQIPTLRFGRLLKVPKPKWLKVLMGDTDQPAAA